MEKYIKKNPDIEKSSLIRALYTSLDSISKDLIFGETDILKSLKKTSDLANLSVKKIIENISTQTLTDEKDLDFAVFLFGSPSRNSMLPNSDLDIGIVFREGVDEKYKKEVREKFEKLPFDKIDFSSWSSSNDMKKVNCLDLIEYNKSCDAKYVGGNTEIKDLHIENVQKLETEKDKKYRIMTEFYILHCFDYLSKITESGPNLKYDFGASRDIIFLDWYYLLKNTDLKKTEEPFFVSGISQLLADGIIDTKESKELTYGVQLIMLVKSSLLYQSRKTDQKSLLYHNDASMEKCFSFSKKALSSMGIKTLEEFLYIYYKSKTLLKITVVKIFESVTKDDLELLKIINISKEETEVTEEIKNILHNPTWHNTIPFAINSKSKEILIYILKKIINNRDFVYVLRILSENKYIDHEIIIILLNSDLPEKYKDKLRNKIQ